LQIVSVARFFSGARDGTAPNPWRAARRKRHLAGFPPIRRHKLRPEKRAEKPLAKMSLFVNPRPNSIDRIDLYD
jgi:hypothetical protein